MRRWIYILAFVVFLYPVSIDGVSVNYSFLLLPLLHILARGHATKPSEPLLLLMGWYVLIFVIASLYQHEFHGESVRRLTSFLLFMSMFAYMFVRLDAEMIASFKAALLVTGLLLAISSAYLFFNSGGSSLGFEAKDLVGSQRFGFIYLLGIWIVYLYKPASVAINAARYAVMAALVIGLALTFSRTSIVALVASAGLYALASLWTWLKRPSVGGFAKGAGVVVGVGALLIVLNVLVPLAFSFFETRLISFVLDPSAVSDDLTYEGSAGTRLLIVRSVLEFLESHPLTGSGYLGVWILGFAGSAHSQYVDVLFRTGFVGLVGYIALLLFVARYLWREQRSLFWGFVGVIVYGFFHETFKESHGGFVLAFLLGMMSQAIGRSRRAASISYRPPEGHALEARS